MYTNGSQKVFSFLLEEVIYFFRRLNYSHPKGTVPVKGTEDVVSTVSIKTVTDPGNCIDKPFDLVFLVPVD